MTLLRLLLLILAFTPAAPAQSLSFRVSETAGLRRFGYPVTASLECAHDSLGDVAKVRLLDAAGQEVPAQFTAVTSPQAMIAPLKVEALSSP